MSRTLPKAARRTVLDFRRLGWIALLSMLWDAGAVAQTVLFEDNFNNLNRWTSSSSNGSNTNGTTFKSPGSSMYVRDGATVTSEPIAAAVSAARLDVWIRRGSNELGGGSGPPGNNEDLVLEYQTAGGTWLALQTFLGDGTPGEIYMPAYELPAQALHSNLRIRFRMTNGSNQDYWHVDDLVITALTGAAPFPFGACEDFETGLDGWSVIASGGAAGISQATSSSPTSSLFTRSGAVTVISNPITLAGQTTAKMHVWVRRGGSFAGSARPEAGDTLVIEYRTSADGWAVLETFVGVDSGSGGETFLRGYDLPANALHAGFRIRFRQTNGSAGDDFWHLDDVCLARPQTLSYSFDETLWSGATGEVKDASVLGLHGTASGGAVTADATPARAGMPGTCSYGVFDGSNDFVEVADHPALDITSEVTLAAWIRMRSVPSQLHTIVSKSTNYRYHIDSQRRVYWSWNDSSGNVRSITTTTQLQLDQWHHVVVTYRSGAQRIYIDGAAQSATGSFSGTLATNDQPLYIGTDVGFLSSRAFDGFIDEVRIIPRALTATEVTELYEETHPCPNAAAQFTINHDGFGIHCAPETITVSVIDSNGGTPLLSYNAQVQLEARRVPDGALAGFGAWSLVAGSGTLNDGAANDGIATYSWPLGESEATFAFSYSQGPSPLDIDVFQVSDDGIRDTEAEGHLVFAASGFTVTAASLANPPAAPIVPFASTQTAGNEFPIHIAAYGQTPDDPVCGVIEGYTGPKSLKFWSQYANPATGSRAVQIGGVGAASTEGAAVAQGVVFTDGQATVIAKYKDVGLIQVLMKDDAVIDAQQLPAGIRGATASFVVKPYDFVLSDIRNAAGTLANPQAVDATGAVFVAAGSPFRMTVTARDADGSATPNYGREAIPEDVRLVPQLHAPAGGAVPPIGAAVGFGAFASGVSTGVDFAWQEVGIVRLRAGVGDGDYLGAGDVLGAASEPIGRFVPSHFNVTLNAPLFASACAAGGFSYLGQRFHYSTVPVITTTARSASGALVQNYTGEFFKLATGTSQNRTYTTNAGTVLLGTPPAASDPVVVETAGGSGTLTFGGGTGFWLDKSALLAPFDADIRLAIDVRDADGVVAIGSGPLGNPVTFGMTGGIPFTTGAQMRYGRIRLGTAAGSELVDLSVPMLAEHYESAAAGFVVNANDTCSGDIALALAAFTQNLGAGETCVRDSGAPGASGAGCAAAAPLPLRFTLPPSGASPGHFNLRLAAPGAGNNGSVLINATVPDWLRYDWNAAVPGDENPSGHATFGVFGGESKQIYIREIY